MGREDGQVCVWESDQFVSKISFSTDRQTLLVNRGTIHIDPSLSVSETRVKKAGNNIMLKEDWIECGNRRVLWLPHEYRSDVSTVYDNTLAIGCPSGVVRFLQITQP